MLFPTSRHRVRFAVRRSGSFDLSGQLPQRSTSRLLNLFDLGCIISIGTYPSRAGTMDGNGASRERWMGTVPVACGTVAGVQRAVHGHLGLATHHDPDAGGPWIRGRWPGQGVRGRRDLRPNGQGRRLGKPKNCTSHTLIRAQREVGRPNGQPIHQMHGGQ